MNWRVLTEAKQNWDLKTVIFNGFVILIIAIVIIFLVWGIYSIVHIRAEKRLVTDNGVFIGETPIEIYEIFDKDTGVYYAVTEGGGICIMEDADGNNKIVDSDM